jgi:hypothetical protein
LKARHQTFPFTDSPKMGENASTRHGTVRTPERPERYPRRGRSERTVKLGDSMVSGRCVNPRKFASCSVALRDGHERKTRRNLAGRLADPRRFERVASTFGGPSEQERGCDSDWRSSKALMLNGNSKAVYARPHLRIARFAQLLTWRLLQGLRASGGQPRRAVRGGCWASLSRRKMAGHDRILPYTSALQNTESRLSLIRSSGQGDR